MTQVGKKHFDGPGIVPETIKKTWSDIEQEVMNIAKRINYRQDNIEVIVGLSRGGLIPGVMLSHALNVPFVPLVWQTRDGNVQWTNHLQVHDKPTTLVVDDLIDSGETFYQVKETAPDVKYCALYNKQPSISLDYWGSTLYNEHRWLDFPWEKQ